MTNWENIVEEKELDKAAKLRRNSYNERKDYTSAREDIESEGWTLVSQYANPKYSKYRKEKPVGEQFEDSVWMMFYNMGFYAMNKNNQFRMVNDPNNPALTKQIDVFAVEDEIVFIIEAIQMAISRSAFLSEYGKKNVLKKQGTIDFDNIDKTAERLFEYLTENLRYIQEKCPDQWKRGKEGFLTINRGIQACIRVIDDITSLLVKEGKINPLKDDTEKMVDEVGFYLDPLCKYFNEMSDEQERELKYTYGTNADTKFYRFFQKQVADAYKDFSPEGLEMYFEDMSKKYNNTTRDYLFSIENSVRQLIEKRLKEANGQDWRISVPKDILKRIHSDAYEKQLEGEQVDEWSLTTFKDFEEIATYGSNWSTFFDKVLVRPEDMGKGKKEEKLAWLNTCDLERTKMQKNPSYSVPGSTFNTIKSIFNWICEEKK